MIKPAALWVLCKTCTDSKWIGDVCRALGGQDVELDFGQQQSFNAINADSNWMDERIEWRKEANRKRVAEHRQRKKEEQNGNGVMITESGNDYVMPSIHPSVPPSIHPDTPNGVCDIPRTPAPARVRGDVPDFQTVVSTATAVMGVPEYFASWWYHEMNARDWRKTDGNAISHSNWRPVLKSWWNRATDDEKAALKAEAEKPAPAPVTFAPADWQLCRERCAHCGPNSCRKGVKIPPQLDKNHPHTPEECPRFAKLPPKTPVDAPQPSKRTTAPQKRTNAPQGRISPPADVPTAPTTNH